MRSQSQDRTREPLASRHVDVRVIDRAIQHALDGRSVTRPSVAQAFDDERASRSP